MFWAGDDINLTSTARINELIGSIANRYFYDVIYDGERHILNWYENPVDSDERLLLERNVEKLIAIGKPGIWFAWPKAILENDHGFGYPVCSPKSTMHDSDDYLLAKTRFTSEAALRQAAINIAAAFKGLHKKGLFLQSPIESLMIDSTDGSILFADPRIFMDDANQLVGEMHNPRRLAPEHIGNEMRGSMQSDTFLLAVTLFLLLFANHPLEGRKWMKPCLTPEVEAELYGTSAVFIFDPNDETNRPVQSVHGNAIRFWGEAPEEMKGFFIRAFSKEAIGNPDNRISACDWLVELENSRFWDDNEVDIWGENLYWGEW